jgi:hypothetical protein
MGRSDRTTLGTSDAGGAVPLSARGPSPLAKRALFALVLIPVLVALPSSLVPDGVRSVVVTFLGWFVGFSLAWSALHARRR